jgi:hypothetical protein
MGLARVRGLRAARRGGAMRGRGVREAGELLELAGLEAGGLGVLADGTLIRALEVGAVNPLLKDEETVAQLSERFHRLLARIPERESLTFYAISQPLDAHGLCERERARAERAAGEADSAGRPQRAQAMRRLAFAQTHSVLSHAPSLPAMSVRYLIVCPYRGAHTPRVLARRGERVRRVTGAAHERRVRESARYAQQIAGVLRTIGLACRQLSGAELADLLWEQLNPALAAAGLPRPSARGDQVCGGLELAGSEAEAAMMAGALREVLCQSDVDCRAAGSLRVGGTVQQSVRLGSVPDSTWLGWLMHLMVLAVPFTLAVHVHTRERHRERMRQKRRWKRLYGVNQGTALRGRLIDPEAIEREQEAAEVNQRLATSAAVGICDVAVYLTARDADGNTERLAEELRQLGRELLSSTDARLNDGRFAQAQMWQATLPLGHDPLRRGRRYLTLNAADTIPLVGCACGSPESDTWIPLGFSHPGRTLDGIDPYDPEHPNHLLTISAQSGGGKTMATNIILSRILSKGATGAVIDRAGHYEFLSSLLPDAASVRIGSGDTLNPWDGDGSDPEQIAFLLALHDLLLGAGHSDGPALTATQDSLLGLAIRGVYQRCRLTGETPREMILAEELQRRYVEARDDGAAETASTYRTLADSLHSYVADGPYAWLCDRESTVPQDASVLVFDTRDIPEKQVPAALLVIVESVLRRAAAVRDSYLSRRGAQEGPWAGRTFLVIDEAWKLLEREATARRVSELGRRSRHFALFVIAISQELADFTGKHAGVLMSQASMRLFLAQQPAELGFAKEKLRLTDEEITAIAGLVTSKREYSQAFLMNGKRGNGTLTVSVSGIEYWTATSDPANDEQPRQDALRQAEGNPWKALKILCESDHA